MTMSTTMIPTFEPPHEDDDEDTELWLIRAPAHLDVSALLDGVTLDVDSEMMLQSGSGSSSSSTPNNTTNTLATFKRGTNNDGSSDEKDGMEEEKEEYALVLDDARELDILRLLVPDKKKSTQSLIPHHRPFHRQIHLTSVVSSKSGDIAITNNNNKLSSSNVKMEMILAPPPESAPPPAIHTKGNGSVDAMRLAYIPVPQRLGMKRRWTMPGGGGGGGGGGRGENESGKTTTTSQSMRKKPRVGVDESNEAEEVVKGNNTMAVGSKNDKKQKEKKKKGKKSH